MNVQQVSQPKEHSSKEYRKYIDSLSKEDLIVEFMFLMEASTGKQLGLQELEDVKYLVESLLTISRVDQFRFQLQSCLKSLKREMEKIRPN
jgi:hypothetical protein